MALVMLVMAQIAGGIGRPGLTSESTTTSRRPRCTTTTAISVMRSPPPRPHARRLDVHHREGAVVEQRRALRLRYQAPAPIGELADAGVGAEQRDGDPLAHRVRRPGQANHPLAQRPGRSRAHLSGPRAPGRAACFPDGPRAPSQRGPPERQRHAARSAAAPGQLGALDRDDGAVLGVGPVVEGQEVDGGDDPEARRLELAQRLIVPPVAQDRCPAASPGSCRPSSTARAPGWYGAARRRRSASMRQPHLAQGLEEAGPLVHARFTLPAVQDRQPLGAHEDTAGRSHRDPGPPG